MMEQQFAIPVLMDGIKTEEAHVLSIVTFIVQLAQIKKSVLAVRSDMKLP
jgi:hypothetical protein